MVPQGYNGAVIDVIVSPNKKISGKLLKGHKSIAAIGQ
jgi:hypothetical protein